MVASARAAAAPDASVIHEVGAACAGARAKRAMAQVLLYADERALAAYLVGAAAVVPDLAAAACEPFEAEGAAYRGALVFLGDQPRLPPPAEDARGAVVLAATYDRAARTLTIEHKPRGLRLRAASGRRGGELARALAPVPWARPPEDPLVAYLVRPGAPLAALITEHLELGKGDLRFAPVTLDDAPRVLVDVDQPSWFVLERWLPRTDDVTVFRRATGPLGPRRVWVEWGLEHPLEAWLAEPKDEQQLLLIDRAGRHLAVDRGALRDVGELLDLDPTRFGVERLAPSAEPERIVIPLRLEGRGAARDPELWLLPHDQRERLEHLLAATPEEELRNLLVACVARPGGARLFAVREALTGRAPRLLPLGKQAYAPLHGLPNLLVPCDRTVAPPLSNDRYARAFGLRPGELVVCEPTDAGMRLLRLDERLFRPIEGIIDFVADGEAARLEQVVLAAPFDLGELAEEDLVPAAAPEEPRRKEPRSPQREAPVEAEPARPAARARRERQPAPAAPRAQEAPAAALAPDPRRAEIARLERELVLERATPAAWRALAGLLQQDGQLEEALRAHESALWELSGDDARAALTALAGALGEDGAGQARDTAGLYRRVLAFPAEAAAAAASGRAERYRALVERAYAELREHEGRLRKKTRWLLWRAVLGETGDAIELERQREDVIAELVLRGVEEREVPPFVRRVLLEHYGLKAATGSGAGEALAFLERARSFAQALRHPAMRAEALAHVAWAFAELGEGARALAVAQQAEEQAQGSGAPPHHAFRARALARVGAVHERASGHGRGAAHLERALAQVARLLGQETDPRSQESADAHKALVACLGCLADVRGGGAAPDDPLLGRALQLLAERPPERQALALAGAAKDLLRLGAAERGRALARALLHRPQLGLIYVQDAVAALEALLGEQPPSADDAERIVAALLATTERDPLDEHSIPMLLVALRGARGAPWDVVERMRQTLLRRGQHYPAALVRVAGLRRLAELRDRQRGAQLLATALDEAWELPAPASGGALERMRVVTRLAALVPAFGMRERGLELLAQVKERALREPDLYVRNELLMSTAMAASRLGESGSSLDLLEDVALRAVEAFQAAQGGPRRAGTPSWVMFETLDACAGGVAELGDAKRGLPLVQRLADVARAALRQSGSGHDVGRFFYLHSLIQGGHAALALGDAAAAEKSFADAFTRMREAQGQDLIDLLQKAAETAGQLQGAQRYALARQVLESAEAGGGQGDLFERFTIDLTARIARDMVQGESAFAAALKRWKGREERGIRDRVALERLG